MKACSTVVLDWYCGSHEIISGIDMIEPGSKGSLPASVCRELFHECVKESY